MFARNTDAMVLPVGETDFAESELTIGNRFGKRIVLPSTSRQLYSRSGNEVAIVSDR